MWKNASLAKMGTLADDDENKHRAANKCRWCYNNALKTMSIKMAVVLMLVWSRSSVSERNCSSVSVFFVRWRSEQFSVAVRVACVLGLEQLRALASPEAWRCVLPSSFLAWVAALVVQMLERQCIQLVAWQGLRGPGDRRLRCMTTKKCRCPVTKSCGSCRICRAMGAIPRSCRGAF